MARRAHPRQARLATALKGIDVRPLDERLGRAAGELLAGTGTCDVVDAALVLLAANGDEIVTSDRGDLAILAERAGVHVDIVPVWRYRACLNEPRRFRRKPRQR